MAWNPEHLLAYENEMRAKRQAQSDAENRMYDEQRRAKQSAELAALRDRLAAAERDNARLRRSMQEAAAAIRCYDPRTMSKTALAWTADCLESIAALAEATPDDAGEDAR